MTLLLLLYNFLPFKISHEDPIYLSLPLIQIMSKPFVPVYEGDIGPHIRPCPPNFECTPMQFGRMEESRIIARKKKLARMLSQSGTTPISARATAETPAPHILDDDRHKNQRRAEGRDDNKFRTVNGNLMLGA